MKRTFIVNLTITLTIIAFLLSTICITSIVLAQNTDELYLTVILTVEGAIDTYDDNPNEFLDPLYYIWIDINGNPNDAKVAARKSLPPH